MTQTFSATSQLGWYFHLPACATVMEVELVASSHLSLLLEAHLEHGIPMLLGLTGHLLERLADSHNDVIDLLRGGIDRSIVELAGTTYVEVCTPLISADWIARQIDADLKAKRDLLKIRPQRFWPGNLAWSPLLPGLLARRSFVSCLVDENHLELARQTQLWKWMGNGAAELATTLVDVPSTVVAPTKNLLRTASGHELTLEVPSSLWRKALSFGTSGAIHRAWDDGPTDRISTDFPASAGLVCVDDGDRCNPVSIHQYRRLLKALSKRPPVACSQAKLPILDFLPAWMPGGEAFWNDTAAMAYRVQLARMEALAEAGALDIRAVLELQDVFPVFWKRHGRADWYYERIARALDRALASPLR